MVRAIVAHRGIDLTAAVDRGWYQPGARSPFEGSRARSWMAPANQATV
jgi:hypothetical protein